MAVHPPPFPTIPAIGGFRPATMACGIKKNGQTDLLLMVMDQPCAVAGVLTRNQVQAAPVQICREHLAGGMARALVVNSGNANAANGPSGKQDALAVCQAVAEALHIDPAQVFPGSTGVIGQPLPVEKILAAIPTLAEPGRQDSWHEAARAIMTTDTFPKGAYRQVTVDGVPVRVAGIAKGAGMIHPNMATLLGYLFSDAAVAPAALQVMLDQAMAVSFNAISVDGDTSTNDTILAFASGAAGNLRIEDPDDPRAAPLAQAIREVCHDLAEQVVRDGEGATKLIRITVTGAASEAEAKQVAMSVARSPLVKTAFFGSDPNWGRILAAVGYAGVPLRLEKTRIYLDQVRIVDGGVRDPDYTEEQGQAVMAKAEIPIRIELGLGDQEATIMTCDLSYDYVRINADYRS